MFLRHLGVDAVEEAVYRAMLARSDCTRADLAALTGIGLGEIIVTLDRLVAGGLAVPDPAAPTEMRAVRPSAAFGERLDHAERELRDRQHQLGVLRAELAELSAQAPHRPSTAAIEVVETVDESREQLAELAFFARSSVRALHPARRPSAAAIAAARPLDRRSLRRGVRMHVIHDIERLTDESAVRALRALAESGVDVRCGTGPLHRLIIVDDEVAMMPKDGSGRGGALVVRQPGLVAVLVQLFEGMWQGSTRLPDDHSLDHQERRLLTLLASGCTDHLIARRIGLSERHVRRLTAQLMRRLHADSRFAAGAAAVRRGWI